MPRVGFSYQPLPNTVIRGGIGVYASTLSIDTYGGGMAARSAAAVELAISRMANARSADPTVTAPHRIRAIWLRGCHGRN